MLGYPMLLCCLHLLVVLLGLHLQVVLGTSFGIDRYRSLKIGMGSGWFKL